MNKKYRNITFEQAQTDKEVWVHMVEDGTLRDKDFKGKIVELAHGSSKDKLKICVEVDEAHYWFPLKMVFVEIK